MLQRYSYLFFTASLFLSWTLTAQAGSDVDGLLCAEHFQKLGHPISTTQKWIGERKSRNSWILPGWINPSQKDFAKAMDREFPGEWSMFIFSGTKSASKTEPLQFGLWAIPFSPQSRTISKSALFFPIRSGTTEFQARLEAEIRLKEASSLAFVVPGLENGTFNRRMPPIAVGHVGPSEYETRFGDLEFQGHHMAQFFKSLDKVGIGKIGTLLRWQTYFVENRPELQKVDFISYAKKESWIYAIVSLNRALKDQMKSLPLTLLPSISNYPPCARALSEEN